MNTIQRRNGESERFWVKLFTVPNRAMGVLVNKFEGSLGAIGERSEAPLRGEDHRAGLNSDLVPAETGLRLATIGSRGSFHHIVNGWFAFFQWVWCIMWPTRSLAEMPA